ncbi:MAG: hypothetical protein WBC85_11995, partial [Planktotalea sp.]|uniref:hypothetical protein n=1 Tax=Planktotalea sp. TaxID=2029877 RepID=UPI003C71E08B
MLRFTAVLLLTTSPLAAQEFYGSTSLTFGQSDTVGAPVGIQGADGTLGATRVDLSFGRISSNGLYLQADLGLAATNNANTAPNTANSSSSLILRAGRDVDRFSYGAFVGALQSDHDNDASDDAMRLLAGIEGAWALNDRWAFDGHLGYLTGNSGSDSVATVTEGVFTGIGVRFAANERLNLGTSIGYLNASMDAPSTVVELWTLELRADYDIRSVPGLSLFAAAQYGESHQKEITGPDDITDTTTIMAGITYHFGAKRPKTANLTYLE